MALTPLFIFGSNEADTVSICFRIRIYVGTMVADGADGHWISPPAKAG